MSDAFRSVSVPELRNRTDQLLQVVLDQTGRLTVEVDGHDELVLLTKRELDSLEGALAMLAAGSEAERLCRQVAREANATSRPGSTRDGRPMVCSRR